MMSYAKFSNKRKPLARDNSDFADNSPERMQALFEQNGFEVVALDDETLLHSSIIHALKVRWLEYVRIFSMS